MYCTTSAENLSCVVVTFHCWIDGRLMPLPSPSICPTTQIMALVFKVSWASISLAPLFFQRLNSAVRRCRQPLSQPSHFHFITPAVRRCRRRWSGWRASTCGGRWSSTSAPPARAWTSSRSASWWSRTTRSPASWSASSRASCLACFQSPMIALQSLVAEEGVGVYNPLCVFWFPVLHAPPSNLAQVSSNRACCPRRTLQPLRWPWHLPSQGATHFLMSVVVLPAAICPGMRRWWCLSTPSGNVTPWRMCWQTAAPHARFCMAANLRWAFDLVSTLLLVTSLHTFCSCMRGKAVRIELDRAKHSKEYALG